MTPLASETVPLKFPRFDCAAAATEKTQTASRLKTNLFILSSFEVTWLRSGGPSTRSIKFRISVAFHERNRCHEYQDLLICEGATIMPFISPNRWRVNFYKSGDGKSVRS